MPGLQAVKFWRRDGIPLSTPSLTFLKERQMSDTPILIVATFAAATGKGNALYEVLNRCVAPSRLEEGNVHYDLYRSVENSDLFPPPPEINALFHNAPGTTSL
ncbi:putative quinol monooxygenase [Erwinia sp. MYb535]|uniref:putative quinol monooxygenase n=1 Tax=Erwinia sp. MYb535 TaxID=2745309 RepID=UPI0030B2B2D6